MATFFEKFSLIPHFFLVKSSSVFLVVRNSIKVNTLGPFFFFLVEGVDLIF
jgi:hypothetical protein